MTEIESQWKVVQEYIRAVAGRGPETFRCLPASGPKLEAVHLRACAAEFKRYEVVFRRWGSVHTNVEVAPAELIWRMRLDTQSGQLVWSVDRLGRALSSEELAQAILEQLNEYCTGYERELQSFFLTDETTRPKGA
jgi:hypothetical protein